ncbi:MAG: glycosyltransferase family 4 protein [Candidatus Niyogibacteria bacterium]|nr:glycosyltransferase family 4 protein [Candidatus Niyogibacteria bacterium]
MEEINIKPSIIIFSTAYLPFVGGAEIAVKEITDRINNFQFDMITARLGGKLPKSERIGNVNVYRIGFGVPMLDKYLLPFWGCFKAHNLHKKKHYRALWSIMASYAGFGALFFKIFQPKIPFVLTLQEGDSEKHILKRVGIFYSLWKKIFKKADYIQAISNYLADFARRYGAVCPIEVVPNGVDINKFTPPNFQKKFSGAKKAKEEKIIITVSRLVEKNAVQDIVEAMKYLPENVKLFILGNGLEEKNLKSLISNLKIKDRVSMFGAISHKELPKYLARADIFIRPSLSEGMGNSFIEAMAAGLPVIGTPVGGIVDFLKDGETGLFCKVRDPKSIAEKVKMLLADNRLRQKIISNAQRLVFEKYGWDKISNQMNQLLTQISKGL